MRNSNSQRAAAFILAGVLAAMPLFAQRPPAPNPGGPKPEILAPDPLGRCLSVLLDLTDAQKAQIRTAVEAAQPALRVLNTQLRADHEALKSALEAPSAEACTVGAALLKVKADEGAIKSEMESLQRKIEAVLTLEQKAKFAGCLEGLGRGKPSSPRG